MKMHISRITLQEYADIYEGMTERIEDNNGFLIFHSGKHPDYDGTLIIFENKQSEDATLILLGAAS